MLRDVLGELKGVETTTPAIGGAGATTMRSTSSQRQRWNARRKSCEQRLLKACRAAVGDSHALPTTQGSARSGYIERTQPLGLPEPERAALSVNPVVLVAGH
jgi:hypothetical protein